MPHACPPAPLQPAPRAVAATGPSARHTPLNTPRPLAQAAALVCLAVFWAIHPMRAYAADEPVDVPITRGKIDLSGLKPTLALPGNPASTGAGGNATPANTGAAGAAAAATGVPPAVPAPSRPKPRTVAEYAAEAKAKAAAEAAAKTADVSATPAAPAQPQAAAPAPMPVPVAAPIAAATAPSVAPAPASEKATDKPAPNGGEKTPPKPPAKSPAPMPSAGVAKPRDEGLDKVAVKLVEAMARAAAKQDKRDAVQPKTKAPLGSKENLQARSAALAPQGAKHTANTHGSTDWAYHGPGGPEHWAQLKPEFNTCAAGQRQAPIAIDNSATLQGPAEAIRFDYHPSEGSVVHSGHTVQVDVTPTSGLTVRDSNYQLLQIDFHHPGETTVNGTTFAMSAHLLHKNAEGQLAMVAVLLTPGEANTAVDTVWKYMPVDRGDRVKLPAGALNLSDLLPKDQRYYQFMGSLTTPPCTEGVLWMVLKTPVTVSPAQIRLFGQLFPNNARPVQPLNGRPVREAL